MVEPPPDWQRVKQELRRRAIAVRRQQPHKERLSRRICRKLTALPEYLRAVTVMSYIGVCGEVRTRPFLAAALGQRKRVVVPYCAGGQIGLFWLRDLGELAPGVFGIPEPRAELRLLGERRVEAAELDLIVVPGVAFDRCGGRLGHGKGYYDGLLRHVRPDAAVVALAFECQLVPAVPMLPHDIFMHKIITQRAVYQRRGPQ